MHWKYRIGGRSLVTLEIPTIPLASELYLLIVKTYLLSKTGDTYRDDVLSAQP